MFFFSFFLAYFYYSLTPSIWVGGLWPPKGVVPVPSSGLAAVNTFFLLLSGVFLTWAHASLIVGDRVGVLEGLSYTLVCAGYFTMFQYLEYKYLSIHMNDSVFGSIFFMITGFHGFHVIIGTIFIFTCFCRVVNPKNVTFTKQHHFGFMAALWYWHFVDVVWLFVFFVVYVWGPSGCCLKYTLFNERNPFICSFLEPYFA
jgi:cytochrome c oxidase subunit 3